MANFHLKAQIIKKASGRGIISAAAYRSGEKILDEQSQITYNYSRRSGILYSEIMAPMSAPNWVYVRHILWNTVNTLEKRKDSQFARELLVTLPKELSPAQYIELLRGYAFKNFVKEGMIVDFAIHAPREGENYHAHILLTMRSVSPNGFGNKVREWNLQSYILKWRENWGIDTNRILEREGFDCRIDHRSRATKEREQVLSKQLYNQEASHVQNQVLFDQGEDNIEFTVCENQPYQELEDNDSKTYYSFDGMEHRKALSLIHEVEYAEILSPVLNIETIRQNLSALISLHSLKDNPYLSLSERTIEYKQFASNFKTRMVKLNFLIKTLSEGKFKDRFLLQKKLEIACFSCYSNQIHADILEEKNSVIHYDKILLIKQRAKKWGDTYLKYASEWHSRAVRDNNYLSVDQKEADKVHRIKALEDKRWSGLYVRSKSYNWNEFKLKNEKQLLQKSIDDELALYYGLEPRLGLDRGLGR